MIRSTLTALGLAAALALPSSAAAQFSTFGRQCTPGAMQMCMSFWLALEYDPTPIVIPELYGVPLVLEGSTRLRLGFANLQGTPGYTDLRPALFRAAYLWGLETTWTTPHQYGWFDHGPIDFESSETVNLHSTWTGTPTVEPVDEFMLWEAWSTTPNTLDRSGGGGAHQVTTFWLYALNRYGLFGCDHPDLTHEYFVGCGAEIETEFYLPGRWSFTDQTRVEFEGFVYDPSSDFGPSAHVRCTTGVDCVTVEVPEPGSLLLLGTGLLGIVGVRWRRRRAA